MQLNKASSGSANTEDEEGNNEKKGQKWKGERKI